MVDPFLESECAKLAGSLHEVIRAMVTGQHVEYFKSLKCLLREGQKLKAQCQNHLLLLSRQI